jgi:hypothetical protein
MPPILIVATAIFILLSGQPVLLAQEDGGWPREIDAAEAKIVIYQPQVETFKGDRLTGRAAVSVTPKGKTEPIFGAMWMNARVSTDRDNRTVEILDSKIENVRLPEASAENQDKFIRLVEAEVPKWNLSISLDRLLASLELADRERVAADKLNMDPPAIMFVSYSAVLISIDGQPELRSIEDSSMMRVVNTPFTILHDSGTKAYYLFDGVGWRTAKDVMGPWKKDSSPPQSVVELTPQADPSTEEPAEETESTADAKPPIVIVATEPTELIVSDGEPQYSPIDGTGLLYMSNTESDVFVEIASQQHYVLLSGRWFQSASMKGPWANVAADRLPADFAKIPPDSTKGEVLAFVAGTQEAQDAIMDAHIPQTSAIERSEANNLVVTYDGQARFEKIEGTEMEYGVNTSYSVLRIDKKYYCAYEGAWFVSDGPYGPFAVATTVPREQIDSIPPENPHYNVKYVYVYDYTPTVVYVGYTPGYTTTYIYGGTVVYGTGYYYPGWYGPNVYYSYPRTWGFHVRYNPWTGWSFGLSYSTGRFTFGIGYSSRWYRPGRYYGGWWGPAGRYGYRRGYARGYARGYVPRARPATRATTTRRMAAPSTPRRNNVYADRNGNVHRRTGSGNWQTRSGGSWSGSGQASRNLNNAHTSRQRGTTRTNSYHRSGGRRGGRR